MSANNLLLWMSARGAGSWQQFRAAVEELHIMGDTNAQDADEVDPSTFPLYQSLRLNIQRIGHAEFFYDDNGPDWRVTPPSLAISKLGQEWHGLVIGARSPGLQMALTSRGINPLPQIVQPPFCPDQIIFRSKRQESLIEIAEKFGLVPQSDAPLAILTCLPAIDNPRTRKPHPLPFGRDWKIDRYSPEELRWKQSDRNVALHSAGGLFRFTLWYQRYILYCSKGESFSVPGQVGKYLVLRKRRRQVLQYDAADGVLSCPASCRPPFLIERALIMCSAALPELKRRDDVVSLDYSCVPQNIAEIVAALLRQEVK